MQKNILPEIIKLFNIEEKEIFQIQEDDNQQKEGIFWFDKSLGLLNELPNGEIKPANEIFQNLCIGNIKIVKIPWHPREGETFYYPDIARKTISADKYNNDLMLHIALKALGTTYKNHEEASEAFPKDYKKITGKDWRPKLQ